MFVCLEHLEISGDVLNILVGFLFPVIHLYNLIKNKHIKKNVSTLYSNIIYVHILDMFQVTYSQIFSW